MTSTLCITNNGSDMCIDTFPVRPARDGGGRIRGPPRSRAACRLLACPLVFGGALVHEFHHDVSESALPLRNRHEALAVPFGDATDAAAFVVLGRNRNRRHHAVGVEI